ncbi:MAG: hypothetical protein AVDCRST_MAG73-3675, partial [uncultured Thermomicrobiales bacterium]
ARVASARPRRLSPLPRPRRPRAGLRLPPRSWVGLLCRLPGDRPPPAARALPGASCRPPRLRLQRSARRVLLRPRGACRDRRPTPRPPRPPGMPPRRPQLRRIGRDRVGRNPPGSGRRPGPRRAKPRARRRDAESRHRRPDRGGLRGDRPRGGHRPSRSVGGRKPCLGGLPGDASGDGSGRHAPQRRGPGRGFVGCGVVRPGRPTHLRVRCPDLAPPARGTASRGRGADRGGARRRSRHGEREPGRRRLGRGRDAPV